jgi:hypothetical protein
VVAHPCSLARSLAVCWIMYLKEKRKEFTFETQNTVGSYGLMSSYNAIEEPLKILLLCIQSFEECWRLERKQRVFSTKHTCIYEYRFTDKTKYQQNIPIWIMICNNQVV